MSPGVEKGILLYYLVQSIADAIAAFRNVFGRRLCLYHQFYCDRQYYAS